MLSAEGDGSEFVLVGVDPPLIYLQTFCYLIGGKRIIGRVVLRRRLREACQQDRFRTLKLADDGWDLGGRDGQ